MQCESTESSICLGGGIAPAIAHSGAFGDSRIRQRCHHDMWRIYGQLRPCTADHLCFSMLVVERGGRTNIRPTRPFGTRERHMSS